MRHIRLLAAFFAVALFSIMPAKAQDADAQSCKFAQSLGEGTDAIIDVLTEMAAQWNEADRAKLDLIFRPQLAKFQFESGKVYNVASFAPFMQEYLVVSGDFRRASPIFFRLKFGGSDNGYVFRNIVFNTDFEEIFEVGTLSPPVLVDC